MINLRRSTIGANFEEDMGNFRANIKKRVRKYVSPMFLALLFISCVMWYLIKLSYDYTVTVPVDVEIAGNRFRITAVAEGSGYRLLSHRIFRQNRVMLDFNEVQTTPSVLNFNSFTVDPYSLQNAISVKYSDIRIVSVGEIPEITPR